MMEQDQLALSVMSLAMNSHYDASCYSEYARRFGYDADALKEFITNVRFGLKEFITNTADNKTYRKLVGSMAEGTNLRLADADIIMIDQCSSVGYNPQEATYSNKVYFRLTSGPSTRPGYTKLQIYHNGKPIKIDDNKSVHLNYFFDINKEKIFLTNLSIFPFRLPSNDKLLYTEMHGPATTTRLYKQTLDRVPAYESQIIPTEMMPWFERHRPYNWPTKETRDRLKLMGCCYVGVGHLKSQEQSLEWRISPTRQELYLMLNINPTQYRCYIALKVIKREFIKKECDDMLSSYHCKTALFYTIETTGPDIWKPHNLIQCVLNCLKLLLNWVTQRNCPNYFIPEENILESKLIDNYKIQKLQEILDILHYPSGSLGYFMNHNPFLKQFISKKDGILSKAIELKVIYRNFIKSNITQCSISEQRKKIMTIYNQAKCPIGQNNLIEIKMLCPYEPDNGLLVDILEEMILHLERLEHLLSVLSGKMTVNKCLEIHKDITHSLPEDFQYCLKLASIAMAQNDYVICDELLQKARHIAYRASVICGCDFTYLFEDSATWIMGRTTDACEQKITSAGKSIYSMSINQIMQQFTMCLNFNESELEGSVVIAPLHLETYKTVGKSFSQRVLPEQNELVNELISIHPVTFMYFLQYKNSWIMKKKSDMFVALEKLVKM